MSYEDDLMLIPHVSKLSRDQFSEWIAISHIGSIVAKFATQLKTRTDRRLCTDIQTSSEEDSPTKDSNNQDEEIKSTSENPRFQEFEQLKTSLSSGRLVHYEETPT